MISVRIEKMTGFFATWFYLVLLGFSTPTVCPLKTKVWVNFFVVVVLL